MSPREVRMRCIEALGAMGVRESTRLIRDADVLAEWVMAAEAENATAPAKRGRPAKTEDKGE